MDELFLLPPVSLALPRAYWLPQPFLSSQLLLITPSTYEWSRIETLISRPDSGYDMDILNTLYKDSSLVLPHRPYNMLSGEFRSDSHERYLGSQREVWNAERISKEAKYIHFSDWPVPKPWLQTHPSVMDAHRPNCTFVEDGKEDCGDREVWEGLYRDFGDRREVSSDYIDVGSC